MKTSRETPPRPLGGKAPLVLIVDDEPDEREFLCEYLVFHGYHAVTAANGGEALFLASKLSPDLIIMDLSMPVLDGLDTTRLLKSHPPTVAIPIIALTAQTADRRREATDTGCLLVVAKPVDLAALEREIRRIVQRVS